MTKRRSVMVDRNIQHFDWIGMVKTFLVPTVVFMLTLVAFYYSTKNTLDNHEKQFIEVAKKFDAFNSTLKGNFEEWTRINKSEQDKSERIAKEDREAREKMRDQFTQFVTQLTTNMAGTKVQVDSITKQLDAVTNKLDSISSVQQENRLIRQQGPRR